MMLFYQKVIQLFSYPTGSAVQYGQMLRCDIVQFTMVIAGVNMINIHGIYDNKVSNPNK